MKLATSWLQLAGCKKIFYVDSKQQEGIPEILEYLREEGDVMPWEEETRKQQKMDRDEPEDTTVTIREKRRINLRKQTA